MGFAGHVIERVFEPRIGWIPTTVFVCDHDHPTRAEAKACQRAERERRRLGRVAAAGKAKNKAAKAPARLPERITREPLPVRRVRPVGGWPADVTTTRHGAGGSISQARRLRKASNV